MRRKRMARFLLFPVSYDVLSCFLGRLQELEDVSFSYLYNEVFHV